ncbi:hypothetical protein M9458_008210, partial [Cirrhinus mrigala]
MKAEEALWGLRQGGRKLERYVEDFLKLANLLSWHDAALGACFQLGLDDETIRCDFPVCEYPLIKLINLVLYLNGFDFEVEEDYMSRHPAPSGTCRVVSAHTTPGTPTYRANGSDCLAHPKRTPIIQGSIRFLSPEPPAAAPRSSQPATAPRSRPPASNVASHRYIEGSMYLAIPRGVVISVLSPSSPLVPSSPPEPERRPEPKRPSERHPEPERPPERRPEPERPPEHCPEPERPPEPAPPVRPPVPAPPKPVLSRAG